ncbi:MAG: holin [Micrococcales bacterium]|jgi:hypothetical protein|nr:holin [Micrococcales bacterium]
MFNKQFGLAVLERALKTFAQALIAVFAAGAVTVLDIDWTQALAVSGTAALLSVLTSVVSANFGNYGPSLANEAVVAPLPSDGLQP